MLEAFVLAFDLRLFFVALRLAVFGRRTVMLTVTRFLHLGTGVQIYPPGAYIYPLPRFLHLATRFLYLGTSTDDPVQ